MNLNKSWGGGACSSLEELGTSGEPLSCALCPRMELLKLLLTCFSEAMYLPPAPDSSSINPWVQFFCSTENR